MAEVAVAFPSDETTAEVMASRLRAEGIAARVDRGLAGSSWGTRRREESPPSPFVRLAVALVMLALVIGVAR